jgi:hypothetical protein
VKVPERWLPARPRWRRRISSAAAPKEPHAAICAKAASKSMPAGAAASPSPKSSAKRRLRTMSRPDASAISRPWDMLLSAASNSRFCLRSERSRSSRASFCACTSAIAARARAFAAARSSRAALRAVMSVRMPTISPVAVRRSVIRSQRPSGSRRSIVPLPPRCQAMTSWSHASTSPCACGYCPHAAPKRMISSNAAPGRIAGALSA